MGTVVQNRPQELRNRTPKVRRGCQGEAQVDSTEETEVISLGVSASIGILLVIFAALALAVLLLVDKCRPGLIETSWLRQTLWFTWVIGIVLCVSAPPLPAALTLVKLVATFLGFVALVTLWRAKRQRS
jgi:hypothetical protein